MYTVVPTDQYGRIYSSKGLLDFPENKEKVTSFRTFSEAKTYAEHYINLYPQAVCNVHESRISTPIHVLKNEQYWQFRRKTNAQWTKVNTKGMRVLSMFFYFGIAFAGLSAGLLGIVMNNFQVPTAAQLITFPVISVVFFKTCNWLFARYC